MFDLDTKNNLRFFFNNHQSKSVILKRRKRRAARSEDFRQAEDVRSRCSMLTQTERTAKHRDPQTLNGVGVKGLVGERRKSLL